MIESPLIEEMLSTREKSTRHADIVDNLEARFGTVPADLAAEIRVISDEKKLRELHRFAAVCPELETFRVRVRA